MTKRALNSKTLVKITIIFIISLNLIAIMGVNGSKTTSEYPNGPSASSLLDPRNIYGVFVDVKDYPPLGFSSSDLTYPHNDRLSMQSLFIADFYAFPEWSIFSQTHNNYLYLLENENATKINIAGAIQDIATRADSNDLFVFYYSGHGDWGDWEDGPRNLTKTIATKNHPYQDNQAYNFSVDLSGQNIICVQFYFDYLSIDLRDFLNIYDADTNNLLYSITNVNFTTPVATDPIDGDNFIFEFVSDGYHNSNYMGFVLRQYYAKIDTGHYYLCTYDSLDSNSSEYGIMFRQDWLAGNLTAIKSNIFVLLDSCFSGGFVDALAGSRRFIMSAAQPNETSLEAGMPYYHGIFTYSVLNAFGWYDKKYDPNNDSLVSLGEFTENVTKTTVNISAGLGNKHTPKYNNQLGDDFSLEDFRDRDGDGASDRIEFLSGSDYQDPKSLPVGYVRFGYTNPLTFRGLSIFLWIMFFAVLSIVVILMIISVKQKKTQRFAFISGLSNKEILEERKETEGEEGPGTEVQKTGGELKPQEIKSYNALEVIHGNISGINDDRDLISYLMNRGKPIILKNPKEVLMPLRCAITGRVLDESDIDEFPVRTLFWRYPEAENPDDQVQYKIKLPICKGKYDEIIKNNASNQKLIKLIKIMLVSLSALWGFLAFGFARNIADPIFLIGLLLIGLIILLKLHPRASFDQYIYALRRNKDDIEIKIMNKEFEEEFKTLNHID